MIAFPQDTVAFRAVLDSVFAGPAYRWAEEPGFIAALRAWWWRLGEWLEGLRVGNPVAFRLLVAVLLVLLLLVFAHAAYVAYGTLRGAVQSPEAPGASPAAALRDAAWYRREADRAAAEGRLSNALQLAFAALALTLDSEGLLHYQPSMTPAECAAGARVTDADRRRLRGLVGALYAYVFGGQPCTADDYVRWREAGAAPWHPAPSRADSR